MVLANLILTLDTLRSNLRFQEIVRQVEARREQVTRTTRRVRKDGGGSHRVQFLTHPARHHM